MAKSRRRRQGESAGGMPGRRICRDNAVGMIQAEILRVLLLQHQVTADDIHDRLEIPSE